MPKKILITLLAVVLALAPIGALDSVYRADFRGQQRRRAV